jgi:hypothetical protein
MCSCMSFALKKRIPTGDTEEYRADLRLYGFPGADKLPLVEIRTSKTTHCVIFEVTVRY